MEYELILRIFIAAVLGGLIGLEREYRAKEAGFRTHFLVALGSALFMIVSAYGFGDVQMDGMTSRWDVSRIAAQVVSGIGFMNRTPSYNLHTSASTGHNTASADYNTNHSPPPSLPTPTSAYPACSRSPSRGPSFRP